MREDYLVAAGMPAPMEGSSEQDFVHSIAASPRFAEDGLCFLARQSGLYRSEDGGATWSPAYDGLDLREPLATTTVAFSPDFAADATVFAGAYGAILRSPDQGRSWHVAVLASPPPLVTCLVVSPAYSEDGIAVIGTMEDGVLRSTDRGSRWVPWNFGLLDLSVLTLAISPAFAEDETLFGGTDTGLFISSNGGRAWRETSLPAHAAPILSLAVSPGYAEDGVVFAGTEATGIWRSSDRGETWERLGEEWLTGAVNAIVLAADFAANPQVLAVLDAGARWSADGGHTWSDGMGGLRGDGGIASVAAPSGLSPGAPLLFAMDDGNTMTTRLPN